MTFGILFCWGAGATLLSIFLGCGWANAAHNLRLADSCCELQADRLTSARKRLSVLLTVAGQLNQDLGG